MIKDIQGISIKGRCFPNKTNLEFFPGNSRMAIVYGRNGSGKSTISEGFFAIKYPTYAQGLEASLTLRNGVSLSEDDQKKIFVYNEEYVDGHIKINKDGLGSIVLFGHQVELQGEIDQCQGEHDVAATEHSTALREAEAFKVPNALINPETHWESIKQTLKTSWATRERDIKGLKINQSVTDEVIRSLPEPSETESLEMLQEQYAHRKRLLDNSRNANVDNLRPIREVEVIPDIDSKVRDLLAKAIEQVEPSPREQQILELIHTNRQNLVESAQRAFSQEGVSICPYCLQAVSETYREELLRSIKNVLNKDVENHRAELRGIKFPELNMDYDGYNILDSSLVNSALVQQRKCEGIIATYRNAIQDKTNNLYNPIDQSPLGLEAALIELNSLIAQLNNARQDAINAQNEAAQLRRDLLLLNRKMAAYEISDNLRKYKQAAANKNAAERLVSEKFQRVAGLKAKLESLRQQQASIKIAADTINAGLKYIFFDNKRLSLAPQDGKYCLKSNGRNVNPKDISVGERNALALCYFFTHIFARQDVDTRYKQDILLVIDDPVSSFDFDNRVGVTSFLNYQIQRVAEGNPDSKLVLLTHDLTTAYDLHKSAKRFARYYRRVNDGIRFDIRLLRLVRYTVEPLDEVEQNEYTELLDTTYRYASSNDTHDELTIGNVVRRLLEAFSTFNYKCGFEDIAYEPTARTRLNGHSAYFQSRLHRIVLHGESHSEVHVRGLIDDLEFRTCLEPHEKRLTCRDILCLLYLLNPDHVKTHLKDDRRDEAIHAIEAWIGDLPVVSPDASTTTDTANHQGQPSQPATT